MPSKYKKKLAALYYLGTKIEAGRVFTESEINDALDDLTLFRDHATVRREMFNKHLLNRENDGSRYEKEADIPSFEEFMRKYL